MERSKTEARTEAARRVSSRARSAARSAAALAVLAGAAACAGEVPAEAADDRSVATAAASQSTPAFPDEWPYEADSEALHADRAAVSTTDAYATRVGIDVLRAGGNAVDAAVAVSFALAVVNPQAGNLGGGGFLVVRTADGATSSLDYRETAPLAATRDMYLDEDGNLTDRSVVGRLASGVPGTVRGMWEAHARYGDLPWEDLLEPAIELADGYVVRERQEQMFRNSESELRRFEATERTFLPEGRAPRVGETFRQPDLAATLRRIRDEGAEDFYTGRTADLIVAEMERGGGLITHEDLAGYEARWREPVRFRYRDHTVVSMPPASSGGATLAAIANVFEGFDLASMEWHSPTHLHLLAESYRRAYADRNTYLADTDFVDVPLERMISKTYADLRRADVDLDRATPSTEVEPGLGPAPEPRAVPMDGETTHVSIVDEVGNAVAFTTTLNSWFGSKVTVEGAGFVLNNEMDDFSAKPGTPNQYGLVQGEANAVQPGKRMLSAMTPTLVLDPAGQLRMVTGTPGGGTIITTVFQTISNVVDFGMNAAQAVHAPRVHHQHLPDQLFYEPDGVPESTLDSLRARGHTVLSRGGVSGDAQVIVVRPDGTLEAMSDPRRGGTALGY